MDCNDASPILILKDGQGLLAQLLQLLLRLPGSFCLFICDVPGLLDVPLGSTPDVADELGNPLLHLCLDF